MLIVYSKSAQITCDGLALLMGEGQTVSPVQAVSALTLGTLCSGITWMTKEGLKKPNYWGSLTQAATCRVGNYRGEEAYTPFSSLLPMVHPNNIVWGGWDISGLNLADAMERAQVGSDLILLHGDSGALPTGQ